MQMDVREEQLLAVERNTVRHADVTYVAARTRGGDRLHHRLLGSNTLQHRIGPTPLVSSLMRATPSSPRSVTMSVAPNSRASFWRASWRLMAMILSAPNCLAERTARSPTAPSPTTTTVAPGFTFAASAANQPVPRTSDA